MRKPLLQWLPTLLALWITLSVILACGCNDEAREDVPKASASGEPSSVTTPMADAAGGTPVEITPTATPGQLETGSSVTPDNGKPTPMPGSGPPTGSTATATPEPEPTRAATSTSTPTPQPTAAQPATAIPAPETSRMSVDKYLAEMCVQEETARSDQEMTDSGGTVTDEEMKQRSFELGTQIAALEASDPPAEFGYFHEQLIVLLKSEKAVWDNPDEYKGETVVGFVGDEPVHAPAYIAALFDNLEVFTAAMKALDPGVRELLAAAGCNLEGLAGMDANETDIELEVGESVQAALDKPGEWDNYFLEADQGERYVIEVGSGTVPDMWVILPDGLQVDLESKPGEERKPIYWEAEIGGMHHIVVGGDGTGSYSISVSLDPRPEGPTNVRSVHEGSAMRVSWEPADGADYYNVYFHDNDYCASGVYARTLGGCEELATNVSKTTYLHASPSDGYNYYWVVACNKEGCSEIDSDNPATQSEAGSTGSIATPTSVPTAPTPTPTPAPTAPTPTPTTVPSAPTPIPTPTSVPTATATPVPQSATPSAPTNMRYALEGSAIRITWDRVAGADYYNVYHDDLHDSRCTLNRDGSPRLCDELAMNIVGTTYLHTSPGVRNNYYWVTACTGEVCSEIESANPATPIEAIPSGPGNVRYTREGAAIRVNWDPEVGADYYTVYYDDFHDSRCRLNRDGNPGFCEELATNVTQTTYVHTEPDKDKNYYWVVACNRGGCSEIDSDNPAVPSETSSTGQTGADSEPTGRREVRFTESGPTARSILENTPGGINVGDPVTADADGKLTYTMSGPDAGSFSIVSSTGQVRTRNGVTYDYETRNRYQVNVGASDGDGGSASIDVVINIENLVPACEPVRNLRTNHGDRHLVVNWTPASQRENSALVQGYQVQMLHGDNGARTGQYLVLGRSIGSAIFDGLQNLDKYWFQIRPIGAEGDCGWSPPFLGIPATYLAPMYPGDRFRTDPVGGPNRNWRFLTDGRCRYTRGDLTADANCTYSNTGPDTSRIVLEFDDPSRGSCDIALAFSSLTAGSFVEDCFGAGVNTETPFDTSFRMPSLAPRAGDNVDPTPSEEVSQLAPRNQDEFDWLVFGRDDFIPGLCFGSCLSGDPPEKGVARTLEFYADGGSRESYGDYEYERTGPNRGKLTLRMRGGGAWVFLLDFEPSGNVRATITDRDGNVTTWPGSLYADLTLGAQPILLPIPPSWWAAIAIEADYTPEELAIDGVREEFVRNALVGPLLARAVACPLTVSNCTGTNFSQDYLRLGRNRAILTVEFPARDPEVFDSLEEPLRTLRKTLNGSTYSFDITYTADRAAEYTLTITKEGHVPVVKRGFVDFKGDSIELDEFPEEIRLPVAPPQATGQDRSHVAVAAALSASRIRGNDLQTFLISDEGLLPASYQPGEWLEPKDGSNQRMMIVSAGPVAASSGNSTQGVQYAATNWFSPNSGESALATHAVLRDLSTAPTLHLASFASSRSYLFGNTWSPHKLAAPAITQLQVVCMQQDSGIPTRGDRYFSQPKSAEGVVQLCQRDCVLNETTNIQQCVWECEENARRN